MTRNIRNDLDTCHPTTPVQLLVTQLIADGALSVTGGTSRPCRKAILHGFKALTPTNNASAVKIGWSNAASEQPISIAAAATYTIEMPPGAKFDLKDLYLIVAADGDGLVIWYW